MVKRPTKGRPTKTRATSPSKKPTRGTKKSGANVRLKPDPKLLRRLAQLGMSTNAVDEPALSIFLELQRKHKKIGELAFLYDAAIQAMKAAVFRSDDPQDWIKAAREAAKL